MNKKLVKFAVLPLAVIALASCAGGETKSSAAVSSEAAVSEVVIGETYSLGIKTVSGTQASYSFTVESFANETIVITKNVLQDASGAEKATDVGGTAGKFTGLTPKTSYSFVSYYTAAGKEKTFKMPSVVNTSAMVAPHIAFDVKVAATSLTGTVNVEDPDGINTNVDLSLLDSTGKAITTKTTELTTINFTSLTASTSYKIDLHFKYTIDGTLHDLDHIEDFTTLAA
jgi:hypothetical protein